MTNQSNALEDFNVVRVIASYFGEHYTHFTKCLRFASHSTAVNWLRTGKLKPWRRQDIMDAAKSLPKSDRDEIKSLLDWGIS